jgi:DNA-binding transcriptional LysR family regulator
MRLTLDALLVLEAIDRTGSFAAGAAKLFRVPSAVSYTIHKLEQDLGVVLFDRSGHRAKLTSAGAWLLREGHDLLRRAEEIELKVKETHPVAESWVSVTVADIVSADEVCARLRAFYDVPGHEALCLRVESEPHLACWPRLLAGRSDVIIGAPVPVHEVDGYRTQPLAELELALVMPPDHPLAHALEPLSHATIARHRQIRQCGEPCDGEAVVAVSGVELQVSAIRHGLGIGFVPPNFVRGDLATGRLIWKSVLDAPTLALGMAWRASSTNKGLPWILAQLVGATLVDGMAPRAVQSRTRGDDVTSRAPIAHRGAQTTRRDSAPSTYER